MNLAELRSQIALGEDSRRHFKRDVTNADSLAAEMAAFANSEGGTIYLGVGDDGSLPGLIRTDVARLNQLIGNAASQHVRSPLTVHTENVAIGDEHVVISQNTSQKIVGLIRGNPEITIAALAASARVSDRTIKNHLEKLRAQGHVRRIGPDKGGHWEVTE